MAKGNLVVERWGCWQVEVLEKSALDTSAILERVQAVEESMRSFSSSKLSPFSQVEILERLEKAEFAAERALRRVGEAMEDKNAEAVEVSNRLMLFYFNVAATTG